MNWPLKYHLWYGKDIHIPCIVHLSGPIMSAPGSQATPAYFILGTGWHLKWVNGLVQQTLSGLGPYLLATRYPFSAQRPTPTDLSPALPSHRIYWGSDRSACCAAGDVLGKLTHPSSPGSLAPRPKRNSCFKIAQLPHPYGGKT